MSDLRAKHFISVHLTTWVFFCNWELLLNFYTSKTVIEAFRRYDYVGPFTYKVRRYVLLQGIIPGNIYDANFVLRIWQILKNSLSSLQGLFSWIRVLTMAGQFHSQSWFLLYGRVNSSTGPTEVSGNVANDFHIAKISFVFSRAIKYSI